jgi:hypothetical protein
MQIKLHDDSGGPREVLGIYWVNGKRYFWFIPYEGYTGFLAVSEDGCRITDAVLSSEMVICKGDDGRDVILHWAAHDLLEDLVDHDSRAMAEFLKRRS